MSLDENMLYAWHQPVTWQDEKPWKLCSVTPRYYGVLHTVITKPLTEQGAFDPPQKWQLRVCAK